jgi:ABC-type polysaccharide/polyol phosphate transport system ATPase subunit
MSYLPAGLDQVLERPETEVLVRARGLTKEFGGLTAVDGIDFELYRGEAFGFLGPNGAGKSSTMRMIGCVSPWPRCGPAGSSRSPRWSGGARSRMCSCA